MFGDSWSYLMGHQGATIIPKRLHFLFDKIRNLARRYPRSFPLFCLLYGAIAPFSNDFITISAGAAKIPYRSVMFPLAIGNIIFNVTVACLAYYGYDTVYTLITG
jgi:membrane protein YqaA with SNARE-associated domain